MPKGKLLSEQERAVIMAHHSHQESPTEIARLIGRHVTTIRRFLQAPQMSKPARTHKPNRKLSDRDVRYIRQVAVRAKKTASEIKKDLNLHISERRIQQILKETPYLVYKQCKPAPFLKKEHRSLRVKWARAKLEDLNQNWKTVIFTDEKKFNLSGPDGLNYYWHDLRRDAEEIEWGPQTREGLMVWGAISYKGPIGLEGAEGSMDAKYYTNILEEGLISAANDAMGELWSLQQDNAPIHTAEHTRSWLEDNDVHVLDWPARSPDLNIIENVWGMVVRTVYKDGKRYENKEQLGEAVFDAFMNLSLDYIRNLYHSMPRRCLSVIQSKGAMINY